MKIAILGSTGMLGSAITKFLSRERFEIVEFNRSNNSVIRENQSIPFDVTNLRNVTSALKNQNFDFVINCVGLIKQLIDEKSDSDRILAAKINSEFPEFLSNYSVENSTPVIQIGTDCVFSGLSGNYDENSAFDCRDVYGLSKAEGENRSKSLMTIRTSIIGHELHSHVSLMDWFLMQKPNAEVLGFTNHYWNGVTTLDFARIIGGIVRTGNFTSGVQHLVPANRVSKHELLELFARTFGRQDIRINSFSAESAVDRTLTTIFPEKNSELWTLAGYNELPTVEEMIQNYSRWTN